MCVCFFEISCGHFCRKLKGEDLRNVRQKFAVFFARVSAKFRLNFALGNFLHKKGLENPDRFEYGWMPLNSAGPAVETPKKR